RTRIVADRLAHVAHELRGRLNVLERHLAADEVSSLTGVALVVKIGDELRASPPLLWVALRCICGVEAKPSLSPSSQSMLRNSPLPQPISMRVLLRSPYISMRRSASSRCHWLKVGENACVGS